MKRLTLHELLNRKEGFTPSIQEIQAEVVAASDELKNHLNRAQWKN